MGDRNPCGTLPCAREPLCVPKGNAGSRQREQHAGSVMVPGVALSNADTGRG